MKQCTCKQDPFKCAKCMDDAKKLARKQARRERERRMLQFFAVKEGIK